MSFLGIQWVGINTENIRKLLFTVGFVVAVVVLGSILRGLVALVFRSRRESLTKIKFWLTQFISLLMSATLLIGLVSVWFSDPARMATVLGLMSAGLAFALQQPVTALCSYFVILRGSSFTVGDRISMGGVRGDVIKLGFIQTTIMEMGQPPSVQDADPAMWVKSRQFTGRIVTVSNSKIFAEPVFNYTRDFPYIWEEIAIPITYQSDRKRMETILLEAAAEHAIEGSALADEAKATMEKKFGVNALDLSPRVFYRLTDNWLELTVRFLVHTHLIRNVKDAMSREIIAQMDAAKIGVASATYDIVGFPPIRIASGELVKKAEADGGPSAAASA